MDFIVICFVGLLTYMVVELVLNIIKR